MGPNLIEKFLTFDELMGSGLAKATYYLGLFLIIAWAVFSIVTAVALLFSNFFLSLGTLIAVPLQAIFAILIWRLLAEIAFIFFRDHADLAKDETPSTKEYSEGFTIDAEETETGSG